MNMNNWQRQTKKLIAMQLKRVNMTDLMKMGNKRWTLSWRRTKWFCCVEDSNIAYEKRKRDRDIAYKTMRAFFVTSLTSLKLCKLQSSVSQLMIRSENDHYLLTWLKSNSNSLILHAMESIQLRISWFKINIYFFIFEISISNKFQAEKTFLRSFGLPNPLKGWFNSAW